MSRQSISFTEPNNNWLSAQIESQEYRSKSEVVNDLIRQARAKEDQLNIIRAKLIQAEKSGFSTQGQAEILSEFKRDLNFENKL
jgi:antitoxin ParD1/3/4